MNMEQEILNAFERGKAFGFAEGMRSMRPANSVLVPSDKLAVMQAELASLKAELLNEPVEEHFEDEPQAEELHEIMQSNTHPVEEQDESFDRTASHMAGEYVSYKAELTDEEIIESLAELEHEQWMKWADTIMQTEKISDARFARWASCMIPYADLTEEMKEFDREWARKALAILRKASEK